MKKRILVIDDSESVRKSFEMALEKTDLTVDAVSSGQEGIDLLEIGQYDLVFLDLKMPVIDGITTLRRIRLRNKALPVYIITAFYGEFFAQLQAVEQEGLEFEVVEKPLSSEQIVSIVRGVLEAPVQY